jgi:alpha-beta hydrolase superfamily lysophospholipase
MVDLGGSFPHSLRRHARWMRLAGAPAVVMHPDQGEDAPRPLRTMPWVLWFHGRTVNKELDPGRYQRWLGAGIGCVAIDLPGHGERLDPLLQSPNRVLEVVRRAEAEIDAIVGSMRQLDGFDPNRMGLGGMSAGGMVSMVRLCRAHAFMGVLLESTSGDWSARVGGANWPMDLVRALNPIDHLSGWREIPVLAIHSELDQWVPIDGQRRFLEALRARSAHPERIEMLSFPETGAPYEHAGFGRMGAVAKDAGTAFWQRAFGLMVNEAERSEEP